MICTTRSPLAVTDGYATEVIVDLTAITFCNSTGIGAIARLAAESGTT